MDRGRWRRALLVPIVPTLALTACAQLFGQREQQPDQIAPTISAEETFAYTVRFEGSLEPAIEKGLRDTSQATQLVDRPPFGQIGLERRAEADLSRLDEALRGLGYYDGKVRYSITGPTATPPTDGADAEASAKAEPAAVLVFEVETGPRYLFATRKVEIEGDAAGFTPPTPSKLGLEKDTPAIAQTVLDAEAKLLEAALAAGHALAKIDRRDAVVDHERRQMDVVVRIRPGQSYRLGDIEFSGAEDVDRRYLTRLVPVRTDSKFDPTGIEEGRNALVESGLFSSVRSEPATTPDAQGRLPLTYQLVPRKSRSIGGGGGYQTDEGLNANAFWEHRNYFGAGERLRAELAGSLVRRSATLGFKKPEFFGRRQSLLVDLVAKHEDLDAYESSSITTSAGFERQFTKTLTGTVGLAYRYADVDDTKDAERYGLFSIPGRIDWNFSDDLFDPTKGGRVLLDAGPYFDTLDVGSRFLKAKLTHTRYLPLMNEPRLILAARGSVGTIFGMSPDDIPADERFYAGGAGSVRGIPLYKAGPTDNDYDPTGGRSFAEFATEIRLNITPTIGVVTFLDVGSAYRDSIPEVTRDIRIGTGAGLRYTTPIGPIRFDVAVPVDKKDRIDDPFQFYISIGQAF